jgi:hypothetical protein
MLPTVCSQHKIFYNNGRCPRCYADRMKRYSSQLSERHRRVLPRAAQIRERRMSAIMNANRNLRELLNIQRLQHVVRIRLREEEIQRIIDETPLPPIRPTPVDKKRLKKITKNYILPESLKDPCCICLSSLQANERVRCLACTHLFHIQCIDNWFKRNNKCPLCRKNV